MFYSNKNNTYGPYGSAHEYKVYEGKRLTIIFLAGSKIFFQFFVVILLKVKNLPSDWTKTFNIKHYRFLGFRGASVSFLFIYSQPNHFVKLIIYFSHKFFSEFINKEDDADEEEVSQLSFNLKPRILI